MLKFILIGTLLIVSTFSAPLDNNSSNENKENRSPSARISSTLNRPSPINPNIPSDPKPADRIILDSTTSITKEIPTDNNNNHKVNKRENIYIHPLEHPSTDNHHIDEKYEKNVTPTISTTESNSHIQKIPRTHSENQQEQHKHQEPVSGHTNDQHNLDHPEYERRQNAQSVHQEETKNIPHDLPDTIATPENLSYNKDEQKSTADSEHHEHDQNKVKEPMPPRFKRSTEHQQKQQPQRLQGKQHLQEKQEHQTQQQQQHTQDDHKNHKRSADRNEGHHSAVSDKESNDQQRDQLKKQQPSKEYQQQQHKQDNHKPHTRSADHNSGHHSIQSNKKSSNQQQSKDHHQQQQQQHKQDNHKHHKRSADYNEGHHSVEANKKATDQHHDHLKNQQLSKEHQDQHHLTVPIDNKSTEKSKYQPITNGDPIIAHLPTQESHKHPKRSATEQEQKEKERTPHSGLGENEKHYLLKNNNAGKYNNNNDHKDHIEHNDNTHNDNYHHKEDNFQTSHKIPLAHIDETNRGGVVDSNQFHTSHQIPVVHTDGTNRGGPAFEQNKEKSLGSQIKPDSHEHNDNSKDPKESKESKESKEQHHNSDGHRHRRETGTDNNTATEEKSKNDNVKLVRVPLSKTVAQTQTTQLNGHAAHIGVQKRETSDNNQDDQKTKKPLTKLNDEPPNYDNKPPQFVFPVPVDQILKHNQAAPEIHAVHHPDESNIEQQQQQQQQQDQTHSLDGNDEEKDHQQHKNNQETNENNDEQQQQQDKNTEAKKSKSFKSHKHSSSSDEQ